jgi:hypothetical protein
VKNARGFEMTRRHGQAQSLDRWVFNMCYVLYNQLRRKTPPGGKHLVFTNDEVQCLYRDCCTLLMEAHIFLSKEGVIPTLSRPPIFNNRTGPISRINDYAKSIKEIENHILVALTLALAEYNDGLDEDTVEEWERPDEPVPTVSVPVRQLQAWCNAFNKDIPNVSGISRKGLRKRALKQMMALIASQQN